MYKKLYAFSYILTSFAVAVIFALMFMAPTPVSARLRGTPSNLASGSDMEDDEPDGRHHYEKNDIVIASPSNATDSNATPGNAEPVLIRLPLPTRAGYRFVEWNTEPDRSGTVFSENDIVELQGTVLYAIWEPEVATASNAEPDVEDYEYYDNGEDDEFFDDEIELINDLPQEDEL